MKSNYLNQHKSKNEQFKMAVTFLTGYNGVFKVTYSKNQLYLKKTTFDGDDFFQIAKPPGAYEIESINNEIKRIFIDKGHYNEIECPFTIKPNFSTLGSIIEKTPQGPIISFVFNDSKRNLLGFHESMLYKEYNLSRNHVDISSFDIIFLECDFVKGNIFKSRRSGIFDNQTMTVDPDYKYIEKFAGGIT